MTTLVFSADSSAADYQDARLEVPITIKNLERPIVTMYQVFEILEGESANGMVQFAIVPPASDYAMRFASDNLQALVIRPSALQFTADNWDIPQPFTLVCAD